MTPEQKRTFNTFIGSIFLALGVISWLLTVYFALSPAAPRPAPVLASMVDPGSCKTTLSRMGYIAVDRGGKLSVSQETFDTNVKAQLERATLAASVCKMTLETFCMGESCPVKGVSMTLSVPFGETAKRLQAPAVPGKAAPAVKPSK